MASSASGSDLPDVPVTTEMVTAKMREDWDQRARENPRYYIALAGNDWSDEEYFESGRDNVRREIQQLPFHISCHPQRQPVFRTAGQGT